MEFAQELNGTAPAILRGEIAFADPSRLYGGGIVQYNPSLLVSRKGYREIDKIRDDDQVKAAQLLKKLAALQTGWTIKSPEGKDQGEGESAIRWEVSEFVEWVLRHNLDRTTLENALLQVLTAKDYGFSVTEKVFSPIESGPWKGKLGLKALKTRRPHDFELTADEFGNLVGLRQQSVITASGQVAGSYPIEKFVIFVNQGEFGNWYGKSEFEGIYHHWFVKSNALKWFSMLLEKFAVPWVIGFYDPDKTSREVKNQTKTIMQNLQAGTTSLFPRAGGDEAFDIKVIEAVEQSARAFIDGITMLNQSISRGLLLPGLLGVTADESQGSMARSQTHFDIFLLIVEMDRTNLATDVMDAQIIRQLVDLNFGPQDEYPYFEFYPLTDTVRADVMGLWKELLNSGAVKGQTADEKHIRNVLEFPEIDEEERAEQEAKDEELRKQIASGQGPMPPGGEGGKPPQEEDEEPAEMMQFASRRPNRYEKRVDFAQVTKRLDTVATGGKGALTDALTVTRDKLIGLINRKGDSIDPKFISSLELSGRSGFTTAMKETLRVAFDGGRQDLASEVGRPMRFQEGPNFVPREALAFLKSKSLQITATTYDRLLSDTKRILENKLSLGKTTQETTQELKELFDSYVGDEAVLKDGAALESWQIERIVRTETTQAYNQGRIVMGRDPEIADLITGWEYSAILDARTSEVCASLDGRIFKPGDSDVDRLKPPNHPNCRSLFVAQTISTPIKEEDFVTEAQKGQAVDLAAKGFV